MFIVLTLYLAPCNTPRSAVDSRHCTAARVIRALSIVCGTFYHGTIVWGSWACDVLVSGLLNACATTVRKRCRSDWTKINDRQSRDIPPSLYYRCTRQSHCFTRWSSGRPSFGVWSFDFLCVVRPVEPGNCFASWYPLHEKTNCRPPLSTKS